MKKIVIAILCILLLVGVLPDTVYGDISSTPSVVVEIKGLEGKHYYATLLSKAEFFGGYNTDKVMDGTAESNEAIDRKFCEYQDQDGYYYLRYLHDCFSEQQISWTYFPPDDFKVLLYFPEEDLFVCSESYTRYAFHAYYEMEVDGTRLMEIAEGTLEVSVRKTYDYTDEIISLIARIIITIAIGILLAWLFGIRKKDALKYVVFVNSITQIVLHVALNLISFAWGPWTLILLSVLLEAGAIIVEIILFQKGLQKRMQARVAKFQIAIYVMVINVVSFMGGIAVAYVLPGII